MKTVKIERLITKTGIISLAILAIIGIIATTISMFSIKIKLLDHTLVEDMIGFISLTLSIIVSFCFSSSFLINISRIAAKKENHPTSENC